MEPFQNICKQIYKYKHFLNKQKTELYNKSNNFEGNLRHLSLNLQAS